MSDLHTCPTLCKHASFTHTYMDTHAQCTHKLMMVMMMMMIRQVDLRPRGEEAGQEGQAAQRPGVPLDVRLGV